jgi:hypothetical protein
MKKIYILFLGSIIIAISSLISKNSILSKASYYSIPTNQIAYSATQNLYNLLSKKYFPLDKTDYKLRTKYFDNKTWCVVTVLPINGFSDQQIIIYQIKNNVLDEIAGPILSINRDTLSSYPKDVQQYLKDYNLISGANI